MLIQGGSNMTGTDLYVNKPHSCCAVRLVYTQISPGHIWTTLYSKVHSRTDHEDIEAKWGGWSEPRPGRFTPWNTWYPFYRRLCRPQGQSGRVWKISPPLGFDPQTVQPFVSRYTDYAIPAHFCSSLVIRSLGIINVMAVIFFFSSYAIFIRYSTSNLLGLRFHISPGQEGLCLVSVGCQIEVCASGWSLVHWSPTERVCVGNVIMMPR